MLKTFSDHLANIRAFFPPSSVAEKQSTALTVIKKSRSFVAPGAYLGVIVRRFQYFQLEARATLFAQRTKGGRWSALEEIELPVSSTLPPNTIVWVTLNEKQEVTNIEEATDMLVGLLRTLVDKEELLAQREKELLLWENSLQMQSSIIQEKVKSLQDV